MIVKKQWPPVGSTSAIVESSDGLNPGVFVKEVAPLSYQPSNPIRVANFTPDAC
jgi:hypothetical protein